MHSVLSVRGQHRGNYQRSLFPSSPTERLCLGGRAGDAAGPSWGALPPARGGGCAHPSSRLALELGVHAGPERVGGYAADEVAEGVHPVCQLIPYVVGVDSPHELVLVLVG